MNKNIGFLLLALCSATALHAMDSDFLPTALESATKAETSLTVLNGMNHKQRHEPASLRIFRFIHKHPTITDCIFVGAGITLMTTPTVLLFGKYAKDETSYIQEEVIEHIWHSVGLGAAGGFIASSLVQNKAVDVLQAAYDREKAITQVETGVGVAK